MKCSNPGCNRGIGLIAYQRGWFSKGLYCSKHCRNAFVADAPNLQQNLKNAVLKRFAVAFVTFVAFVGLIVPATFTIAVLAAPPARPETPHLPGCDRNLAATRAPASRRCGCGSKASSGVDRSEICTATRFYFLEMVKARAVTALCKSGAERERELVRLDADVDDVNEAIAARCL